MVQCRVVTTALLSLFLVHTPGCSRKVSQRIPPVASWTFNLRLAASPDIDLALVAEARATEDQDVFRDGNLVASWVPVAATKQEELEAINDVVTRRNIQGDLEILAIISPGDVTEQNFSSVRSITISDGEPKITFSLTTTSADHMRQFTKANLGRYLIPVVDGTATHAVEIMGVQGNHWLIPGDFTQAEVDRLVREFRR